MLGEDITGLFPGLEAMRDDELEKVASLAGLLSRHESAVIAFSGGADSSLLAYIASRIVERTLAVIASSPAQGEGELESAKTFTTVHSIPLRVIERNELEDPAYVANGPERCYHCKLGLFKELESIRAEMGFEVVLDGSTADDLDDHRQGARAARELGVRSPLQEAGLDKADIRAVSRALGLETWDKPQMACLASRIETNHPIDVETLRLIDGTERRLRAMGYRDVRVRVHRELARIEIGAGEDVDLAGVAELVPDLKRRFKYVTLDLEGYRTGSMNG